ncbi:1594_t:CDS:2, partial [Racocetra persica]
LFEKEVELIKKEEEDERLTKKEEKLKKEKIEEVSRISEYIEKISNNSKLRSNAEKYTQIKKTKKALFLEEEKIVQNIKELKNTAPKNTEIIKIPGAENTMQALWENCRKGQFFENLSQELKEEHFCYIKTDKGEKLPEDKTKLAEVIRIYRKIQSQCWGAFVDCYFDKESVFPKDRLEENPLLQEDSGKLGESRGRASEEEIKLLYNSYNSHLIIQGFTMESIYADFEIKSFDACHCLFKFDKKKNRELLVFTEEITTKQKQRTKLIQEIQKNINERKENINNYKENFQSLIPDAPEPKAPETTWTTLF